jgi:heptaprenyl diphosphate synthase
MVREWLNNNVANPYLFYSGLAVVPAFILQGSMILKGSLALLYLSLALLAGRRIRPIMSLLVLLSILVFNLLTPKGRILAQLGPFIVTGLALRDGLMKGLTVVGLIYISRYFVRDSVKLPGRIGDLLGRMFAYFGRLLSGGKVERKDLIGSLDRILLSAYGAGEGQMAGSVSRTTWGGGLFLTQLVLASWSLFAIDRLFSWLP